LQTARSRRFVLFQELRDVADVVTFDQRGTGGAQPRLSCGERIRLPIDQPGDPRAELAAAIERAQSCAQGLRAAGHDLAAYNTVESAHDIEQLRIALGAEKITLWGTSYGTHLSLAYARLYPARVERLVLLGVEGPDHTLKLPSDQQKQLERLAAWIKQDEEVSRAIPDFVGLVREVLARVEREPVVVEVTPVGTTKKEKVAISKWDLQSLTADGIGRTRTARKLPAMYYAMSRGDFSGVALLVRNRRNEPLGLPMSYLMDCASGATAQRLARIKREAAECLVGDTVNFPFPAIDAAWKSQDLGDEFRGPLHSDVPALLVSGSLDGRTPPANAEEILKGFPNGLHLIIEGAGHDEDLFSDSPEMRRRIVAFVAGQAISTEPIKVQPPPIDWPRDK
jgi:pimeloyl-ACP methyl ester carboxylesterase